MNTENSTEKRTPGSLHPAGSAADEYLKTHRCAKWCPICGMIYLFRFAPFLTTLGLLLAAIIGAVLGLITAIR